MLGSPWGSIRLLDGWGAGSSKTAIRYRDGRQFPTPLASAFPILSFLLRAERYSVALSVWGAAAEVHKRVCRGGIRGMSGRRNRRIPGLLFR